LTEFDPPSLKRLPPSPKRLWRDKLAGQVGAVSLPGRPTGLENWRQRNGREEAQKSQKRIPIPALFALSCGHLPIGFRGFWQALNPVHKFAFIFMFIKQKLQLAYLFVNRYF
jgi:hypothetical protein